MSALNIDSFKNITTPRFSSVTGEHIDITCDIDGIGSGIIFTASKNDPMPYGRELFEKITNGEYGEVDSYIPSVIYSNDVSNES
ncbi:hypothetical protein DKP34_16705 [Salmonella enterica subsp. enterica serovar Enteritidis]|nr:hypothetical protein [Salmonella enterica]EBU6659023.1 hypothetical protein [Salmonella enterica subsp. enterica serovar Enteritidis]EHO4927670.1 hypothetical protein [Salmonella enterica subsp. enterica serovar Corvallis]